MKKILYIAFFVLTISVVQVGYSAQIKTNVMDKEGYSELLFIWPKDVKFKVEIIGKYMLIKFTENITGNFSKLTTSPFIDKVNLSNNKKGLILILHDPNNVKISSRKDKENIAVIELTRETNLKNKNNKLNNLKVVNLRFGEHKKFLRLVFDFDKKNKFSLQSAKDNKTFVIVFNDEKIFKILSPKTLKKNHVLLQYTKNKPTKKIKVNFDKPKEVKYSIVKGKKLVLDFFPAKVNRATQTSVKKESKNKPESIEYGKSVESKNKPESVEYRKSVESKNKPESVKYKKSAESKNKPENIKTVINKKEVITETKKQYKGIQKTGFQKTVLSFNSTVRVSMQGAKMVLTFPTESKTSVATFVRKNKLWIVFDQDVNFSDSESLVSQTGGLISRISEARKNGYKAIILDLNSKVDVLVMRKGSEWAFSLKRSTKDSNNGVKKIVPSRQRASSTSTGRIVLPIVSPSKPVTFSDPETFENIVVVPTSVVNVGVDKVYNYPEFTLLKTYQGIALNVKSDNLKVVSDANAVNIGSSSRLSFSDTENSDKDNLNFENSLLKLGELAADESSIIYRAEQLKAEGSSKVGAAKTMVLMRLARFYLANAMFSEALEQLDLIRANTPLFVKDSRYRLARAIAEIFMGHKDSAYNNLFAKGMAESPEVDLWKGFYYSKSKSYIDAREEFERGASVVNNYPVRLQYEVLKQMTENALETLNAKAAKEYLDDLYPLRLDYRQQDYVKYLSGRYQTLIGNFTAASDNYETLERTGLNEEAMIKGEYETLNQDYIHGSISLEQALSGLNSIASQWRGDDFEIRVKTRLAQLYLENKHYSLGLSNLHSLEVNFPELAKNENIRRIMKYYFNQLFYSGEIDNISLIEAVSIFEGFKYLLPQDTRGEEIIRNFADKLVELDLLEEAEKALKYQVTERLEGFLKAKVANRLALVYLMNKSPQGALEVLDTVDLKDISNEIKQQYKELYARALGDIDKVDEALKMIEYDNSLDGLRLKADLYWKKQDWIRVAQVYASLLSRLKIAPNKKLSDYEAGFINNLAIALVLANNQPGLNILLKNYRNSMAATKYKDLFFLLVSNDRVLDSAEELNKMTNGASGFDNFMSAYTTRVKENKLSSIN